MPNLLHSLLSSASALSAYDQVLQVTQNNVANASTPGYVKHRQTLLAMPFDPAAGLGGGVRAGEVESARSAYADQSVRRQTSLLGQAEQDVQGLQELQSAFDISSDSGIPAALNRLYQSFSAWAQSPSQGVARQTVIERAVDVATAFRGMAGDLEHLSQDTERSAQGVVDTVNTLSGNLATLNRLARQGSGRDAGLDAQIHSTLEELSQYVSITAMEQGDGSVSVLMNGDTPLLIGEDQYRISCRPALPSAPPAVYEGGRAPLRLFASDGKDITVATTQGQLGSLLDVRNRVLASYIGDAWQAGDLNRLAKTLADRVNGLLVGGVVSNGDPPQPGVALFSYDAGETSTARTITVDRSVAKPELLAAIEPGPPPVANGVPLALAGLASPTNAADEIDGSSYSEYYGTLAARAGTGVQEANGRLAVQQSAVAQAKNLRQQMSGVSLDEEATILIQFQRAYEANSRLISVLDQMSREAIDILQR